MRIDWLLIAVASVSCSSSDTVMGSSPLNPDASAPSDSAPAVQNGGSDTTSNIEAGIGEAASKVDGSGESGSSVEDFAASASDFDCSRNSEWTTVGLAHYKNALGHTEEMLTVARSSIGGTFPVGTIVQLNPAEAMVKRGQGFDATSNDWEFFTLTDSDAGSTINHRGGGTSVSNARATCLSCHLPAQSTFDLICGDPVEGGPTTTHGCVPLPVSTAVLAALPDPRCP